MILLLLMMLGLILRNEQSLGAFGAGNVGVKASAGDIIAFLDDDAVADVKWVETLVKIYRERDAVEIKATNVI
jgi:glycosyltransferase involved in cell wall biosynthesis